MNDRSMAIAALCSHLCVSEGIVPLEPKEYSELALILNKRKLVPEELSSFSKQDYMQYLDFNEKETERFLRLFDRTASLSFEVGKYESMGIFLLTRADQSYPEKLKKKLGNSCPPLFYGAGEIDILNEPAIGYVGSRSIGEKDTLFTQETVHKTIERGFVVVSGGAKGIDSIAVEAALSEGGKAVTYISDSMLRKLRNTNTIQAIQQGRLLMLSVVKPDAGFNVGIAMMRNKYIYSQSEATVIIKSDLNKGGTWAGATENLKNSRSLTLCWKHLAYPGNKALIEKGAIPVDETWNGDISQFVEEKNQEKKAELEEPVQLNMFEDLMG